MPIEIKPFLGDWKVVDEEKAREFVKKILPFLPSAEQVDIVNKRLRGTTVDEVLRRKRAGGNA